MSTRKIKYLLAIASAFAIIAVIVCVYIYSQNVPGEEETAVDQMISNAEIVNFWDLDLEGCTLSNIASESFYSTKLDKSIQDDFYVIYDYAEYTAWQEKHNDIIKIYPEEGEVSSAERLFENGKIAVVTACSKLQDTANDVLVYCVYTDEENNVTVALFSQKRNSTYQYNVDISADCQQIYTVMYFDPDVVENMNSLRFAVIT